jgi:hypothetical protein
LTKILLHYIGVSKDKIMSSLETLSLHPEAIRPPQNFEVGTIQAVTEISPEQIGLSGDLIPAQIVQPEIADPNIDYLRAVKPGRVEQIQRHEGVMNRWSNIRYKAGAWRRKDTQVLAYEANDPSTALNPIAELDASESIANGDKESREKFFGSGGMLGDPGLRLWQQLIPQASALTPLANPYNTAQIRDPRSGETATTTDVTKEWMTACTDGWEIRNRTAIMVEEMGTYIGKYAAAHPSEKMTVMSIAGGTALGTMQSILRSGVDPRSVKLLLLENNEHSAAMAQELAKSIGYTGEIDRRDTNVFKPEEMQHLKAELDANGEKVIALDAVGIAEYSTAKHRTDAQVRRNGPDYMLYNPDKFVKACLDFVDQDGMAMIGQMRADRPNPYFTRGVVSWPSITMRHPQEFMRVLKDGTADISLTKLSLTPRNTYSMATIYKSERAANLAGLADTELNVPEARVFGLAIERALRGRRCIGDVATRSVAIDDGEIA